MKHTKRVAILILQLILSTVACASASVEEDERKIREEMENLLRYNLLEAWYPTTIDSLYGGFLSDFSYDWQPDGPQNKMIVTQARHVWTSSQAAMFMGDDRYRKIAEHGFGFLKEKMWDATYRGFYWMRNRQGESLPEAFNDGKSAYGNAFAIYALASYFQMSRDTSALRLARQTFLWLDQHSHDPEYGGYLDRMTRDGTWLSQSESPMSARERARAGWKDQNSSIHLLEAFTELYRVWPDSLLRERLQEMLTLVRDTITTEKGYLTLFLERNWQPVSFRDSSETIRKANYFFDHVSFGHDVETAYLMLEASHALELPADTETLTAAKKMVDHSLAKGWDYDTGGFYYEGYYFDDSDSLTIIDEAKTWWVQAEGLNALLLMARLFPAERKYDEAFKREWAYIKEYLIDHERGGWYEEGLDKSPEQVKAPKAKIWVVNYHNARALMNCIKMLKSEHELIKKHAKH